MKILCFNTHVAYLFNLSHINHDFYIPNAPGIWNIGSWEEYVRPISNNIHFLKEIEYNSSQSWRHEFLLQDEEFDLVIFYTLTCHKLLKYINAKKKIFVSQQTFPMYSTSLPFKTEVVNDFNKYYIKHLSDIPKIFVSDFKKNTYPTTNSVQKVIRHGVNMDLFNNYNGEFNRFFVSATILGVKLGMYNLIDIHNEVMSKHNIYLLGTNGPRGAIDASNEKDPFLIGSFQDLINIYRNNRAYVNIVTRDISMALLEAMSTGMPVVTVEIEELKQFFTNEKNILMSDDPKIICGYLDKLSKDLEFAKEIGRNGQEVIKKHFSIQRFVNEWEEFIEII